MVTLSDGVLTDADGRIGEIAADRQFQFDAPPGQPGAIYTDGWSVCAGGALALQGSTAFFQCLSGSFYNLYDQRVGGQCQQVQLSAVPVGAAAALSQGPDGQVQATSAMSAAALTAVSQATLATLATPATLQPVVQISDGQIQATGPAPSAPAPSAPPASAATPPGPSPTPGSTFASTNGTSTRPASSSPASSRPATAAPASARPSSAASLVGAGAHIVAVVVAVAAAVVLV